MGRIRTKDDGLGFPAPGTKVKYLESGSGAVRNAYVNKWVYVCEHPASASDGIVISSQEGKYHGHYCGKWEEETTVVDSLTVNQKSQLVDLALAAAKQRGYCDETKKILADLGLVKTKIVTLTVEIPEGAKVTVQADGKTVKHTDVKPVNPDDEW